MAEYNIHTYLVQQIPPYISIDDACIKMTSSIRRKRRRRSCCSRDPSVTAFVVTATRHGDIGSNRDVEIRSRQTWRESDISVCDQCICCILLCDVVQRCNDVCLDSTHIFPSKRHMDRQESDKASLTSHAFISASSIMLRLILFSTLVRSLISYSSSTLLMPVI
jgi:hypothetical protein